uniref:Uncharacterized protein n=1 Tax=Picea glauca TaxID=3330 RepID=A0A101LZ40_PICGL|nr:hypothetical protein ABT39_MTgene5006 [Picea glauca]
MKQRIPVKSFAANKAYPVLSTTSAGSIKNQSEFPILRTRSTTPGIVLRAGTITRNELSIFSMKHWSFFV